MFNTGSQQPVSITSTVQRNGLIRKEGWVYNGIVVIPSRYSFHKAAAYMLFLYLHSFGSEVMELGYVVQTCKNVNVRMIEYIFPTSLGLHTILVPRSGILSITLQTSYKSVTLSMTIYTIHFKERAYVSSSQIVFNRWGRALKSEVLECSRSTGLWLNSIVR